MSRSRNNWVENVWYGASPLCWLLLPLTWIYTLVTALRRSLYRGGLLRSQPLPVPVIVVGNITAGGTGKTPITIWLAKALKHNGMVPGIVSRGYRGNIGPSPVQATPDSDPGNVGDEAVLLAKQTGCIVVVHPNRVGAAVTAIGLGANVIISDDGLQHYRLARDFEIAVVDGTRGFGNGKLLPAGPLREPVSRLRRVDKVLVHRHPEDEHDILRRSSDRRPLRFWLRVAAVNRLDDSEVRHIDDFAGTNVHAVAGIGNPERFFHMLESHGMEVIRHPLSDHAQITQDDITFNDHLNVFMTEKDAVKCRQLDTSKCWYVPVDVDFDRAEAEMLLQLVASRILKKIEPRNQ